MLTLLLQGRPNKLIAQLLSLSESSLDPLARTTDLLKRVFAQQ